MQAESKESDFNELAALIGDIVENLVGSDELAEAGINDEIDFTDILTTLHLTKPPTDGAPMLCFGRFDDFPHQHLPLARLSASDWKGVMIADEVGLGKTISAIQILKTLHARGNSGSAIIICPGGLRRKWCNELWQRADIEAVEVENGAMFRENILRILAGEAMVLVVSQGILRRSIMLDWLIENTPPSALVIVDEAHHIRNPKSHLHSAVTMLTLSSQKVVLLTATPVNLSTDDLFVQLSQLAPGRWPNGYAFARSLKPGNTLNKILDLLASEEPELIEVGRLIMRLENTTGFEGDSRLEMLAHIVRRVTWDEENSTELRLAAADLVRRLRPLNGMVVRTRRRDLDWQLPQRNAITLDIRLRDEEWNLYVAARDWSRHLMELRRPDDNTWDWAMLMPERMASSSLPAFAKHVKKQMRSAVRVALDLNFADEDEGVEAVELDRVEMRLLSRVGDVEALVQAAEELGDVDSKYDALRRWLGQSLATDQVGGVILFSHFRGTLSYLLERLEEDGYTVELITGQTKMGERERLRNDFAAGVFDILLSSEVGSEGLDQQHCHRMVNYDLPWNPMRLEQRIGRIDRFGQESEVITVLNFAVEGTIDAAVLGRLYSRINLFEKSLGMLDPLLGKAMRLIAREEMRGGNSVLVEAEEMADNDPELIQGMPIARGAFADPNDGVETLLAMREKWHKERAAETREWLGPDPGIDEVRHQTLSNGLQISTEQLRNWTHNQLESIGGDLFVSDKNGCELIELSNENLAELILRCEQPELHDARHVGWLEALHRLHNSAGPNWLTVTFERTIARDEGDLQYITPAHPLIRWLVQTQIANISSIWIGATRPLMWDEEAKFIICLDWITNGLQQRSVRRWLVVNSNGQPLDLQVERPWELLDSPKAYSPNEEDVRTIEDAIDDLHGWLLQDERKRMQPILEELRWNTRAAWEARVESEKQQIRDATWKAEQRGEVVDFRWLRMKEGLIRRLRDELLEHLRQLERLEHDFSADLSERIIIRLF